MSIPVYPYDWTRTEIALISKVYQLLNCGYLHAALYFEASPDDDFSFNVLLLLKCQISQTRWKRDCWSRLTRRVDAEHPFSGQAHRN
jgi:hypothetical protein